ncbi:MAG: cell division protein FtsA, partial [Spirochaetia bacterium]
VRLEAEVHIITGSVTSAQNLVKCVNRAGFRVESFVLDSLASARAVLSRDEMELGVLALDLGGGTTDVLVYLEGAPYFTSVVPVGGAQVTSDLSIMLKTPMESAERIKREAGCCYLPMVEEGDPVIIPSVGGRPPLSIDKSRICGIVQPRMVEIFSMAREKLEQKNLLRHLGGGIVLTGGGALLPGAVELAQEMFGCAARVGLPGQHGGLTDQYQTPELATAVGLVLYAAEGMEPAGGNRKINKESASMLGGFGRWLRNFFE